MRIIPIMLQHWYVYAVLVDVRPQNHFEKAISFNLNITFGLTAQACQPVSVAWFRAPFISEYYHFTSLQVQFDRWDAINEDSMVWWSGVLHFSGHLLEGAWVHAHRMRYIGQMLFADGPAALQRECKLSRIRGDQVDGHALLPNLESTWASLRRLPELVCHTKRDVADFVSINDSFFERTGAFECKSWSIAYGDPYTIVGFLGPKWNKEIRHYPMHMELFMFMNSSHEPFFQLTVENHFGHCMTPMNIDNRNSSKRWQPHPSVTLLSFGLGLLLFLARRSLAKPLALV